MYIDGFLLAAKADRKDDYIEAAKFAAEIFIEHGATRVVENWSDDVPDGKVTSFPMAVKLEEGEVVCFSWIEYPDKATRDACMAASEADPRFEGSMDDVPFNGARLIMGGFSNVLDLRGEA